MLYQDYQTLEFISNTTPLDLMLSAPSTATLQLFKHCSQCRQSMKEKCMCSTDIGQASSSPKHRAIPTHKGLCALQDSNHGMLEWFGLEETLKTI